MGWFSGEPIKGEEIPLLAPGAFSALIDWLMSGFRKKEDGGYELMPAIPYPGELNVDVNKTIMPDVINMWKNAGENPGNLFLTEKIKQGGFQVPEELKGLLNNQMTQGGLGWQPTQFMYDMANQGGVVGPGLDAVKSMLLYGAAANPVGQYMSNIAQFGTPGEVGRQLANRAQGFGTGATNFLLPYAPGSPQIPSKK